MSDPVRPCLFCAIVAGDRAADIVLADEHTVAFLDHRPVFPGHVLLVPRPHVETLPDLPADLLAPLFGNAQRLCLALELGLGSDGVFVAMNNRVSQSVPHLHVHLIPRRRGDGLKGFFWPRHAYPNERAARDMAFRIADAVTRLHAANGQTFQ